MVNIVFYSCLPFRKNGIVEFRVTVPDSITTWVLQAIGVSSTNGFGLAPPLHMTAFKNFFVSLSMPYSAQRGEQVSIVATVFNYAEDLGGVKVLYRKSVLWFPQNILHQSIAKYILEMWELRDILNDRLTYVKLYPQKNNF